MWDFFYFISYAVSTLLFCAACEWAIDWLVNPTPPKLPTKTDAGTFGAESLDDLYLSLRAAAGSSFVDPVREQACTPTTEQTAREAKRVYAEFVRTEKRLRARRARKEYLTRLRRFFTKIGA